MAGTLAARIVLTILGAAGMIAGSFLEWAGGEGGGVKGTEVDWNVYFSEAPDPSDFITSAGLITIIIGVLALLGMAFRSGWLTRIAGALGIVAFVLVLVTLYRVDADISNVRIGLWLVLAGGVLALIGGFMGTRTVVTTTATAPPPAAPPPA